MIGDIQEILSRLAAIFRRRTLDQDFEEEFSAHIDLLTDQNERRGLTRDEARRQAILQMGGLNATRDFHRETRGLPRVERFLDIFHTIARDMIHAARSLSKTRGFTFVCVASLGIGLGTFFGLVHFIREMTLPMPGVNADGLVELLVIPQGPFRIQAGSWAKEEWSYPDFMELRQADTGMAITGWVAGESESSIQKPEGSESVRVPTMFISANYFRTVGVSLSLGSGFDPAADDSRRAEPVVILAHDFWKNRLGSDPNIVGKTVTLNGVPHTVSGVVSNGFRGHLGHDVVPAIQLFIPLEQYSQLRQDGNLRFNRDVDWVHILGRLSPGVGIAQANAMVGALVSGLAERYPSSNGFKAASVENYHVLGARAFPSIKRARASVLGLAGMVLLLVCLNVSGMMLVRGAMRERELSIREALGASRRRLIQYLLSEAVMLAGLGGSLSALVLFGGPAVIAWWIGQPLPPEFVPDGPVIGICIGICLAASMMFGLMPAIRFSRPNLISALKDDAGGGGRRVGRIHRAAVATQVGIAIPFLVVSGVLLDQALNGTRGIGFEPDGLVASRVDPAARKQKGQRADLFLRSVRDNLEQANGVDSVTIADGMPLDLDPRPVRVGRPNRTDFVSVHATRVSEGYLDTIRARLVQGRAITAEDRISDARVAVISEPLARRLFPNGDAVGGQLRFAQNASAEQVFTVVGVTADFVSWQLSTPREQMLLPLAEHPASQVFVIARGAPEDEAKVTSAFQNVLREFDKSEGPSVVFLSTRIVTGKELVRKGISDFLAESAVGGISGAVALALAALGVGGVIGFMAATRTREMAVRMALGASRSRVVRTMLYDVVKLVLPGVAGGLLVAAVLIRFWLIRYWLSSYPLGTVLPFVFITAAAITLVVSLLAGLPSARRAASVAPMIAMRSE